MASGCSKAESADIDCTSCDDKEAFSGVPDNKKTALSKLSRLKRTWSQSTLNRNFVKKKLQSNKEKHQAEKARHSKSSGGEVVVVEGKPSEDVCISNNNTNEELITCNEKNGLEGLVSDKAAGFGNGVVKGINKVGDIEETHNNSPIKPVAAYKNIVVPDLHQAPYVVKECDIIGEGDCVTNDLDGEKKESIAHVSVREEKKSFKKPVYCEGDKERSVGKPNERNFQKRKFNSVSGEFCQEKKSIEVGTGLFHNNNLDRNNKNQGNVSVGSNDSSSDVSRKYGTKSFHVKTSCEQEDICKYRQEQDENTLNEFLFTTLGIVSSCELESRGNKQAGIQIHGPDKPVHTSANEVEFHQLPDPKKEGEWQSLFGDVSPRKETLLNLPPGGGSLCEARIGDTDSAYNYTGQVDACLHDTSSPSYPNTCDTELKTLSTLSAGISSHIYNNRNDSTCVKSDSELVQSQKTDGKCLRNDKLSDTSYNCGQSYWCNKGESHISISEETQHKFTRLCAGVNACNGYSLAQNQPKLQTTTLDLAKKVKGLSSNHSCTSDQKDKPSKSESLCLDKDAEHFVHTAGFVKEIPSSKIQITSNRANTGEWRSERPSSVLKTKRLNKRFTHEHCVSVLESSEKKSCVFSSFDTASKEFLSSEPEEISLYEGSYTVSLDHHTTVSSTLSLAGSVSSKGSRNKKLSVRDLDKLVTRGKPKIHHVDNIKTKEWNHSLSTRDNTSVTSSANSVASRMHHNYNLTGKNCAHAEASVTSNTSQDSGFVPGLVFTNRRNQYGYQSGNSSKFSDSSCLSSTPGDIVYNSRQHPSHRPVTIDQSDSSYGVDALGQDHHHGHHHLQSRSHYERHDRAHFAPEVGLWKEFPDNSGSRPPLSLDSVSIGSSQASSLCLVTAPDAENTDVIVAGQKQPHSFPGHSAIKGVVMREKRNEKRKSRKRREWGTVGNIPDAMIENNTSKHITRPKSFGAGEMYKTRQSFEMIDRIESESEDSDSSIDVDNFDDFSMAEDDSQVGGCSLDDKLRLAANKGQVERIPTLLAQGAGFLPDKEGRTAIHYAALSGYSEAVRILAANGCDCNTKDNLGYTALHRAAAQGHTEVVKVLCECTCNLNIQDDVHGNSALHEAAWNGYSRTVDSLCRHKANVHLTNKAGFSALHLAAQNGHNQSARHLLYANCDSNHKNNYGDTPLHTAGRYGHAGVTRILLSAKCRISEQNKNGDTALHIAAALKRKKIAKLLVESNINISVKNKQNETAADVARRKEHHEIIMIVTSQAKLYKQKKKEDKKKKKEGKFSGIEESDDPRKDKKMFFFKKRSKSKDNKENKENRDASADRLDGRRGVTSSMDAQAGVVSEALSNNSSGRGTFTEQQARLSRDPQKSRSSSRERAAKSQGTSTAEARRLHEKKVHGLLTQYEPKQGVQYYRDLAGNVKQGPIGFAPVCNCGPSIKKIEQRMEADRNNLYDHIDATHKMLTHQIEDVDHKCCERLHLATQECHQNCEEQKRAQETFVNSRVLQERQDTEQMMRFQEHLMRAEYMDYMSHKLGAFEDHYAPMKSSCRGCDHCKQDHHGHRGHHYKDDNDLASARVGYGSHQQQQPAGIYRSKSDETLSVSSSKRHWKMKGKPKSVRQMKEKRGKGDTHKASYRTGYDSSVGASRPIPQGEMVYQTSTPLSQDENPKSSGRTPEGQSSNNEYSEQNSYLDPTTISHYGTWNSRRQQKPLNQAHEHHQHLTHGMSSLSQDKDSLRQDFEKLTVRDYPQSSLSNGHSTSTPISQQPAISRPKSAQPEHLERTPDSIGGPTASSAYPSEQPSYKPPFNTPVFNSPNYNTPNSSYTNNTHNSSSRLTTSGSSSYVLSPDQVQVHHVKTDSGSNPDSGYSSKIYGMRPAVSGRSITTAQGGISPNPSFPVNGMPLHSNIIIPPETSSHLKDSDIAPGKSVHKNRGYSSDGCPGMRRPKHDAYASDNCAGMRMRKAPPPPPHKSALNDWYEKQVSAKGNGVIKEVPTPPPSSQPPQKAKDFWPGKATQV